MSYAQRTKQSKHRSRSHTINRKSTTDQRREIQQRLTGLRTVRTEIDNQCLFLEDLLQQLNITETSEFNNTERHSSEAQPYATSSPIERANPSSEVSLLSFDEQSFHTPDS